SRRHRIGIHNSPLLTPPQPSPFKERRWRKLRPYVASWSAIGRRRMRLPVAAKIALHSAGAKGGKPGSPTPPDGPARLLGPTQTWVIGGDSSMGRSWKPSRLFCCTRPFLKLISPYLARLSPITAAPSTCE